MAVLEDSLDEKLSQLMDEEYQLWLKKDYQGQQTLLYAQWDLLPEPKGQWDESVTVARSFIDHFLTIGEIEEVKKWSEIFFRCDPESDLSGERELYAGIAAYELGNFEEARKYFDIVQKESKGHLWKREDVFKYFKFYKEKK